MMADLSVQNLEKVRIGEKLNGLATIFRPIYRLTIRLNEFLRVSECSNCRCLSPILSKSTIWQHINSKNEICH